MESWIPPEIAPVCQDAQAPLTQCSHTGFMFLTLVAQLFGRSSDKQHDSYTSPLQSEFGSLDPFSAYDYPGFSAPTLETSIPGPTLDYGYRSIQPGFEKTQFEKEIASLYPKNEQYKFQSPRRPPSHSISSASFYMKKENEPPIKYDFESNPYSKFESREPVFDFNFDREFGDIAYADSNKVTVKTEFKKTEEKKSRRKRQAGAEYDFIIVGAGSAGCVLANRLSEVKKWKILLLEAGTEEPDVTSVPAFAPTLAQSSIDWRYRTQPEEKSCKAQRGQSCAWISGKVMGGSSAINYLVYMRGNKRDYDDWAALGNEGWCYDEVLPYFIKSENNRDIEGRDTRYHGVGGLLNVERFPYADQNIKILMNAFNETGLPLVDFNAEQQIGTMTTQTTSKDGKRVSANQAFIEPIRHRPNLIVRTQCQVTKVLINPKNKIAYGVSFTENGSMLEAHAKKEVIISAGGIGSPKILMLSGIGPKQQLAALNIPVLVNSKVGFNLQDHVTTNAMIISLTNQTSTLISGRQLLNEVKEYARTRDENHPLSAIGVTHMSAFIRTQFSSRGESVPDVQFLFDGRNLREFYSDPTTYLTTNILPFSYYDSMNVRPILLRPESRGFLTLNVTHPESGTPLIYPRFFTVQKDIDTLIDALRYALTLEDTDAFRNSGLKFVRRPVQACSQYSWGSYSYFSCLFTHYTSTIFHPAGTCKMGPYWDRDAVVDPRLKVYGIQHLRVADSSIMPNIVSGNTMSPVIMIAEKASDMIKEDWKHYL